MNTIEQAMEKSMELSDEVIADFTEVVADAEALLKATANQGGEKLAQVRAKAEKSLTVVKARMAEAEVALVAKTKAASKATDACVHENPGETIGVAASIGLVIGLLIGRR